MRTSSPDLTALAWPDQRSRQLQPSKCTRAPKPVKVFAPLLSIICEETKTLLRVAAPLRFAGDGCKLHEERLTENVRLPGPGPVPLLGLHALVMPPGFVAVPAALHFTPSPVMAFTAIHKKPPASLCAAFTQA